MNFLVFKQSFKYLKNEKINLSKVILKTRMFVLSEYIYILFYLILYSKSHFDSNKCKKRSNRKKSTPINELFINVSNKCFLIIFKKSFYSCLSFMTNIIIRQTEQQQRKKNNENWQRTPKWPHQKSWTYPKQKAREKNATGNYLWPNHQSNWQY